MKIVIFDSGMGGLTVARAVRKTLPGAELHYLADTAAFPYGAWEEAALVERICAVAHAEIGRIAPDCFVVACNTASTIALKQLRARFDVPFVGTVPAIKPAARLTGSGLFSVLATPGTVRRDYTKALIDTFAYHCEVHLVGCEGLAELAERKMHGGRVEAGAVAREIAPAFLDKGEGRRTDVVVLGCTHYPLLLDEIETAAPWPVAYVDPAGAIARRVVQVLHEAGIDAADAPGRPGVATVTSRAGLKLAAVFARFGFAETECQETEAAG